LLLTNLQRQNEWARQCRTRGENKGVRIREIDAVNSGCDNRDSSIAGNAHMSICDVTSQGIQVLENLRESDTESEENEGKSPE
jgi:hypothetical protein